MDMGSLDIKLNHPNYKCGARHSSVATHSVMICWIHCAIKTMVSTILSMGWCI